MDENDAYGIAMTQVSCGYWLLANRSLQCGKLYLQCRLYQVMSGSSSQCLMMKCCMRRLTPIQQDSLSPLTVLTLLCIHNCTHTTHTCTFTIRSTHMSMHSRIMSLPHLWIEHLHDNLANYCRYYCHSPSVWKWVWAMVSCVSLNHTNLNLPPKCTILHNIGCVHWY